MMYFLVGMLVGLATSQLLDRGYPKAAAILFGGFLFLMSCWVGWRLWSVWE